MNSFTIGNMGIKTLLCVNISLPLVEHKISLTSRHEPEPYVRSIATSVDQDATEETPTATRAPGDEMRMIMTQMR